MRCAVYVRVSTDKEEQKASLMYQRELFYRYIKEQGWDLYGFYVDVQSGTTAKRKELQRMIRDAEEKKFDVILAKELSRLARNGELSYKIKNLCENHGIHIITLDNAINTTTGHTNLFGLYAWLYENESQSTSERVKATFRSRAENGLFKGSVAPYGYEVKNGVLHVRDDDTPHIVKRIFSEYLAGSGRESIARRLYKDGIPTPAQMAGKKNAGDKWHESTIKRILTNPHYTGDLVQRRETTINVTSTKRKKLAKEEQIVIKNTHEAIISREDFEAVQQLLKLRSKNIPAPKKHLFTNVLYCADCGKGMWYRSNRKGYICGNYAKHGRKACSNHAIEEQFLIQTILSDIKTWADQLNKEEYVQHLKKKSKSTQQRLQKKMDQINNEINRLMKRKSSYINLLADQLITHEEYRENVDANNTEIHELTMKRDELVAAIKNNNEADHFIQLKEELLKFLQFDELTPEMLHRLVDRMEVKSDRTLVIRYRFAAPKTEKEAG